MSTLRLTASSRTPTRTAPGDSTDASILATSKPEELDPGLLFPHKALQAVHNKVFAAQTIIGTAFAGNGGNGGPTVAPRGDARKNVPDRDRSLGEGDQAADRNSRLRILVRSSTRFILGISSRSIAV